MSDDTITPCVLAESRTVASIVSSAAAVVMIGGFDGSGNFGDVAQFLEGHQALRSTGTSIPVLAIVERKYRDVINELTATSPALGRVDFGYFDDGESSTGIASDLFPITQLPGRVLFYFSGGGYVNRMWAARKTAMYLTMRRLVGGDAGHSSYVRLVASGLQVDDEGLELLGVLREAEVFGARDARSVAVAARYVGDRAQFSGDDSIGLLLRSADQVRLEEPDASGVVNVHMSTEAYVTANSARRVDVVVGLLERLAERSTLRQVNLIVAFGDERINERAGADRLAAAIEQLEGLAGVRVQVVDITRRLCEARSVLPAAQFCVSSSYHVALASIVAEVPTVLVWSGEYYRDKADALAELFRLPHDLMLEQGADPASAANRCLVIDGSPDDHARYVAGIRHGVVRSLTGRIAIDRALAAHVLALDGGAGWESAANLGREYGAAIREVADLRLRVAELTRARRALAGTLD